jgi:hypothetical protein
MENLEKVTLTKDTLLTAIMYFAHKYGLGRIYQAYIEIHGINFVTLHEMIVYELFINEFSHCNASDEEYTEYKYIHEYAKKLKENGFVEMN